ncbi:MAG: VWA domain-containing protein [Oscillospiraceae bacterium]|nr:VWA domain-containing protein [Oscillospiraceae bacterium]
MEHQETLKRWRLILGAEAQQRLESYGGTPLSAEDLLMDSALAEIYGSSDQSGGGKQGGKGISKPHLTRWLGDLRTLFAPMEVQIIQRDAIERKGMKQLLFEPEMLETLEPDISTAAMLLTLKDQVPKNAKEHARAYIAKIVEEINRRLADNVRRAVTASLNRRAHSPIPSASALDFRMTVRRNLGHYDTERKILLPEKFYFFERTAKSAARTVILDIDQSGSMGESAIFSGVMGCILAGIRAVRTHIVAFDTNVTDLTPLCADPVDLLYGIQLGGGTDINKSVAYCETLITEPAKTVLFLVTDLYEGGNRAALERRLADLKESGVQVNVILAISDSGTPCYDASFAGKLAGYGIPCFACPPDRLPELLESALSGGSKVFRPEK